MEETDLFITTWRTTNANESITIPFLRTIDVYTIDWGDGTVQTEVTFSPVHSYAIPGEYVIKISGGLPLLFFNNKGDKDKILSIDQWGSGNWMSKSMDYAFFGCSNLKLNAQDFPDISGVLTMVGTFANAKLFNGDLSKWNVSSVTDMSYLFNGASSFNGDITTWKVDKVSNMKAMFSGATVFNQNINQWNVNSVLDMSQMFNNATSFNQNLNNWKVAAVTDMSRMFSGAKSFNGDIENWEVFKVTDMSWMFSNASAFNGSLSSWKPIAVTDMTSMFNRATLFNGNIGSWSVDKVTQMAQMFLNATSFNQNLDNWNVDAVISMRSMFQNASSFNGNIGSWNITNVTNITGMFFNASSFNQYIGDWETINLTNISGMFYGASSFNQDISKWEMQNVTKMTSVFFKATAFNQDISSWKTAKVENMQDMFREATSFNQDISSWDIQKVSSMQQMFEGVKLDTAIYDAILLKWSALNVQQNVVFDGGESSYCNSDAEREQLIQKYNWVITDKGSECMSLDINQSTITILPTNNREVGKQMEIRVQARDENGNNISVGRGNVSIRAIQEGSTRPLTLLTKDNGNGTYTAFIDNITTPSTFVVFFSVNIGEGEEVISTQNQMASFYELLGCSVKFEIQTTGSIASAQGRYRSRQAVDASWSEFTIADPTQAVTPVIKEKGTYDLQVAVVGNNGNTSEWFDCPPFIIGCGFVGGEGDGEF